MRDTETSRFGRNLFVFFCQCCDRSACEGAREFYPFQVYFWTEEFFIIFDDRVVIVNACTLIENESGLLPGLFRIERGEVDGSKVIIMTVRVKNPPIHFSYSK